MALPLVDREPRCPERVGTRPHDATAGGRRVGVRHLHDGLVVDASKMATVSIQQVTMAAWVKGESSGNDGTTFESSMGVIMNKEVTYGAYSRILHDS